MGWRVVVRPEAREEMTKTAQWYEAQTEGLGGKFVGEILAVLDGLAENPLLNSRRHAGKDVRWRYPDRFPYRVVYEVDEKDRTVVVAAVVHAARSERHWKKRTGF